MSGEELKIKDELEMAVENDLEEEIKDGIYNLALKLHRLYQHKKERVLKKQNERTAKKDVTKKIVSEVNINIKMEGGTTIEIKEIKRDPRGLRGRAFHTSTPKITSNSPRSIKFDWTTSLRSSSNTLNDLHGSKGLSPINKDGTEKGRANLDLRKGSVDHNLNIDTTNISCGIEHPNLMKVEDKKKGRGNPCPKKGRSINDLGMKTALLELGWKY